MYCVLQFLLKHGRDSSFWKIGGTDPVLISNKKKENDRDDFRYTWCQERCVLLKIKDYEENSFNNCDFVI